MQLTRRQWLVTSISVFSASILAGCAGDSEEAEPTQTDSGGVPKVEVTESTIISGEEESNWVCSSLQNMTEVPHGKLQVHHTVYDEADEIVDSQDGRITFFPAEETWRDYRPVLGQNREDAAYVESEVFTDEGSLSASTIEGIEVAESTLNQDYRAGTEIIGEIENDDTERSQVYLVGLVYTDEGILRGSVGELINDLDPSETRSFRAAIAGNKTPKTREEALPTQHDIFVFDGIP